MDIAAGSTHFEVSTMSDGVFKIKTMSVKQWGSLTYQIYIHIHSNIGLYNFITYLLFTVSP